MTNKERDAYKEKFHEWLDTCPIDFHNVGYQETRIKGSLKFSDDMSRPMYVFYLPETTEDKPAF